MSFTPFSNLPSNLRCNPRDGSCRSNCLIGNILIYSLQNEGSYQIEVFLNRTRTRMTTKIPVSILYNSIAGRYRPVSYPDGPITARYRFIKNASRDISSLQILKNLVSWSQSHLSDTNTVKPALSSHPWEA